MPYIAIKGYPRDAATKKKAVELINKAMLEAWGCPQKAISISLEEVAPEDWDAEVQKPLIETNLDKMMIKDGEFTPVFDALKGE